MEALNLFMPSKIFNLISQHKLIVILTAVALVAGGYFAFQNFTEQKSGFALEDLIAGTAKDLVAGKTVTVNGTTNSDGSIMADVIYIGKIERNSQNMSSDFSPENMPPRNDMSSEIPSGMTPPEGIDFEEIKNLSAEERQQRMQDFASNNSLEKGMIDKRSGGDLIQGKIISKQSTNITIELSDDSGSKIVFYSNNTEIMKTP